MHNEHSFIADLGVLGYIVVVIMSLLIGMWINSVTLQDLNCPPPDAEPSVLYVPPMGRGV